jgi:ATP-dependent Lon protease
MSTQPTQSNAARRVKEQMNKRKPDDEFARINLSFIDKEGNDVIVQCPESMGASATLEPARRRLRTKVEPGGIPLVPPPPSMEERPVKVSSPSESPRRL